MSVCYKLCDWLILTKPVLQSTPYSYYITVVLLVKEEHVVILNSKNKTGVL